jgi:hypothetical protein
LATDNPDSVQFKFQCVEGAVLNSYFLNQPLSAKDIMSVLIRNEDDSWVQAGPDDEELDETTVETGV